MKITTRIVGEGWEKRTEMTMQAESLDEYRELEQLFKSCAGDDWPAEHVATLDSLNRSLSFCLSFPDDFSQCAYESKSEKLEADNGR